MFNKKYELVSDDTKILTGIVLYRIRALVSFGDVSVGDLGGYIESEKNLAQEGNCWVYDDARVYGDAQVFGSARVYNNAMVFGNALVYGDACVYGSARVSDNACVYGSARVSCTAWVSDNACVCKDWKLEKIEDILVLGGKYNVTCYLAGDDLDFSDDYFKNNISNSVLISIMTLGNAE